MSLMPSMFEVGAVCSLPAVRSLRLASLVCSVSTICFELSFAAVLVFNHSELHSFPENVKRRNKE